MKSKYYISTTIETRKLKSGIGYYVRWVDIDGKREAIPAGKTLKHAKKFQNEFDKNINSKEAIQARLDGISYKNYSESHLEEVITKSITLRKFLSQELTKIKNENRINTFKNYSRVVNLFNDHINNENKLLKNISYTDIDKFKNNLVERKFSLATIDNRINALKALFSRAVYLSYIDLNPVSKIPKIKIPEKEPQVFTDEELKRMFLIAKELNDPFYLFLRVALDTGARKNELLCLIKKKHFKLRNNVYEVTIVSNEITTTKSKKMRTVVLSPDTTILVKSYLKKFDDDDLPFRYMDKDHGVLFRRIRSQSEISKDKVFHSFRKTCLTKMAMSGVPIYHLTKYAGHSSITVTEKFYINVKTEDTLASVISSGSMFNESL
ncbi:MAG: hypothetical protein COA79_19095 [Planctomycetota bacterium]|nr:MAG: hypothetical protein COA79_19095 [Planctomycetota bacterium]